jgi:putative transposase
VEHEVPENLGSAIGIDRGVVTHLVTSENKKYTLPVEPIKKQEKRLAVIQARSARRKKFSNNWTQIKRKIATAHRKISNTRQDFLHKTSTNIAKNHSHVRNSRSKVITLNNIV